MGSSYTSANSTASVPARQRWISFSIWGDNLAGPQAILYRRAGAESSIRCGGRSRRCDRSDPEDSEDSSVSLARRRWLGRPVTAFASELGPTAVRDRRDIRGLLGRDSTGLRQGYLKRLAELRVNTTPSSSSPHSIRSGPDSFLTLDEEQEQTRFLSSRPMSRACGH